MLKHNYLSINADNISIYDFENKGDILEAHVHSEANNHWSIVASGILRLFGSGQPEKKMFAGEIIKIEPNAEHGFEALAPRSRLINIPCGRETQ